MRRPVIEKHPAVKGSKRSQSTLKPSSLASAKANYWKSAVSQKGSKCRLLKSPTKTDISVTAKDVMKRAIKWETFSSQGYRCGLPRGQRAVS